MFSRTIILGIYAENVKTDAVVENSGASDIKFVYRKTRKAMISNGTFLRKIILFKIKLKY